MKKFGPLSSGLVETTCVDTTAVGTSTHPVIGRVVAVYIKPTLSSVSAPTVTIETVSDPPVLILEVATDQAIWRYPRTPIHDPADGSLISTLKSDGVPIHDFVRVTLSDAEEGDTVDIWLLLE